MSKVLASQRLAKQVAALADEMKAQDIVILDMRALVNFCDYFVIATGTSDRQVKAIAEGIKESLGLRYAQENGSWVLLDMGDVIVHIFEPQAREFYSLEHLWQDAPKIEYKPRGKKK